MKVLFYIDLILVIISLSLCKKENNSDEEGNILLPMEGTRLEIYFQGKKIGNKNYYTVPLKVGTPEKTFNVQLDTSVATSWLPSVKCKNCFYSRNYYNESESTSSSNPSDEEIELDDEDGDVEGYTIDDDIILNGYKLKNFSFVQVTELDDNFRDHYDGKLGLGYRGKYGKKYNFLDRLKVNKLISKRIFSINQISNKKGQLYIGDTSARKYTYCNVSSGEDLDDIYRESWVCDLTHVGIFNNEEGISNKLHDYTIISDGKVDFDSAYEFIAVPISYRQVIDELLLKANLECETNEEEIKEMKKKEKEEKQKRKERKEEDEKEEKEEKEKDEEEENEEEEKENEKKEKNKGNEKNDKNKGNEKNDKNKGNEKNDKNKDNEKNDKNKGNEKNEKNKSNEKNDKNKSNEKNDKNKKEKKYKKEKNKNKLIYKYNDEEISITCKTNQYDLSQKGLSLSFVLQGNVYSIPLHTLFYKTNDKRKMEMKVKYIDDDDAIWTFGYPFMSQFLMIFNMEDNHVGMKRMKKTTLPVINVTKEWDNWHETTNNFFYKKIDLTSIIIIASILFGILIFIVGFLVWRACKKSKEVKPPEFVQELNDINPNVERVY